MQTWPPHLFLKQGKEAGTPAAVLTNALEQAKLVQKLGLPAILTLRHLSAHTEVPYKFLRDCVERSRDDAYRFFRIRKRTGGHRLICVPHPLLQKAQSWLGKHVFGNQPVHDSCYSYVQCRTVVDCARLHCGCRWLIKLDVRQFFESISERQIYHVVRSLGYQPLVAFEITRLCTRTTKASIGRLRKTRWNNRWAIRENPKIWAYSQHEVGHLPQGAPTSPALSNLAMRRFDSTVYDVATDHGLSYSRYADDLIFSTGGDFSRTNALQLIQKVCKAMLPEGLRPHSAKTHISPPGARKVVLGLLVDGGSPRLRRDFRSKLELHLYYLERHGPVVHAIRRGFHSVFAMKQHIRGLLSYTWQVDPNYALPLMSRFNNISWPID